MIVFYNIAFILIALCFLPAYLVRGKFHAGFWQRLGFLPKTTQLQNSIWCHAVSVGEANALRALIKRLQAESPGDSIVISTVTPTGNRVAQSFARPNDAVIYLPLDLSWIVKGVLQSIKPRAVIIAETELWPNFITALWKRHIPIIVVNARISDRSFRGYQGIRGIISPLLRKVDLFCCQSERDAERLRALGADPTTVRVSGNMKFDSIPEVDANTARQEIRGQLGLAAEDQLLVAASTHPGEEEALISAFRQAQARFPHLRLLLAPRHPQRAKSIAEEIERQGYGAKMTSVLGESEKTTCVPCALAHNQKTVFVLDSIGTLIRFLAASDVVFVGGSLVKKGGHNILEPASLKKPVIFGPHMFNFRDIAELFTAGNAAIGLGEGDDPAGAIVRVLDDSALRDTLVSNALKLIEQNRGATERNLDLIKELLHSKQIR